MSEQVAESRLGVAAFDFDGTLVPGDSLIPFLARIAGPGRLAAVATLDAPSLVAGYRVGGRDQTKAVLFEKLLSGFPLERAQDLGQRYGTELLRRIRPDMAQAVAWHRQRGHRLILVSASLALYLEPFGAAAGFDRVLATRLGVSGGRLSGQLEGANVRGPEKARLLRSTLDGVPAELWAYGDSAGDREMLAMADHPQRIHRRSLRQITGARWARLGLPAPPHPPE